MLHQSMAFDVDDNGDVQVKLVTTWRSACLFRSKLPHLAMSVLCIYFGEDKSTLIPSIFCPPTDHIGDRTTQRLFTGDY